MTVFVVLGAPRSGTSLVAGVLHDNGVDMGAKRVGDGHEENPRGFFEDETIADHHDAILCGMGGNHLYPPPDGRLATADPIEVTAPARARHGKATGDWGWKDPRTVLFWPAYRRLLLDWDAKPIATYRNPLSVALSWLANERLGDLNYALWLAVYYERRLADIVLNCYLDVCHVSFELWWRRFDWQAKQLEGFVGRELNFGLFDERLWRH